MVLCAARGWESIFAKVFRMMKCVAHSDSRKGNQYGESSTLPTGGTSEQMGNGSRGKNHRWDQSVHGVSIHHGINDLVGSPVLSDTDF